MYAFLAQSDYLTVNPIDVRSSLLSGAILAALYVVGAVSIQVGVNPRHDTIPNNQDNPLNEVQFVSPYCKVFHLFSVISHGQKNRKHQLPASYTHTPAHTTPAAPQEAGCSEAPVGAAGAGRGGAAGVPEELELSVL